MRRGHFGGIATAGIGLLFAQQIAEAGKAADGHLTANGVWDGLGKQSGQAAWTEAFEQYEGIVGGYQTTGNTQTVISDFLTKAAQQGASSQQEIQAILSASVAGKSGITPRITSSILQNLGASTQDVTEALASTGLSRLQVGQASGASGNELTKWLNERITTLEAGKNGGRPTSPGSSVTYQYNMSNTHIEANDPGQLGPQARLDGPAQEHDAHLTGQFYRCPPWTTTRKRSCGRRSQKPAGLS